MAQFLFSRSNKIGSRLIRAVTWSEFSHVDLITSKGTLIGALVDGGVQEYPMAVRQAHSTVMATKSIDCPTLDQDIEAYVRSQLGKKYDFTALFGIAFHRDWQEEDKWFCSELMASALLKSGLTVIKKTLNRVTPQDLLQSPYFD